MKVWHVLAVQGTIWLFIICGVGYIAWHFLAKVW